MSDGACHYEHSTVPCPCGWTPPEMCDWAAILKGWDANPTQCCRLDGHDGPHCVYVVGGSKTLMVYEVSRTLELTERMRAQVKLPLGREEVCALVEFFDLAYRKMKSDDPPSQGQR